MAMKAMGSIDFLNLKEQEIEIVHYAGQCYAGTFGIEFKVEIASVNQDNAFLLHSPILYQKIKPCKCLATSQGDLVSILYNIFQYFTSKCLMSHSWFALGNNLRI